MIRSLFERVFISLVRLAPHKLARHLLFLIQSNPDISDNWGYHIRPIHYYEPLPDFGSLTHSQIERRRPPIAIDLKWTEQLDLLHELTARYSDELNQLQQSHHSSFNFANDFFGGMDAAIYYSLIRSLCPRRIIEIGSGFSTQIAKRAVDRNRESGSDCVITCIEPHPERLDGLKLNVELIQSPVEEIHPEFFSDLSANDILFIDSTHTVKFGSDVCYEFLQVLPILKSGVWVHVHDIFFPHDYPAEWILERRLALNEQYLLEAFLTFANDYSVRLANHWLLIDHPTEVRKLWPNALANGVGPSSFWMSRN